jgi:hypothetical protein
MEPWWVFKKKPKYNERSSSRSVSKKGLTKRDRKKRGHIKFLFFWPDGCTCSNVRRSMWRWKDHSAALSFSATSFSGSNRQRRMGSLASKWVEEMFNQDFSLQLRTNRYCHQLSFDRLQTGQKLRVKVGVVVRKCLVNRRYRGNGFVDLYIYLTGWMQSIGETVPLAISVYVLNLFRSLRPALALAWRNAISWHYSSFFLSCFPSLFLQPSCTSSPPTSPPALG